MLAISLFLGAYWLRIGHTLDLALGFEARQFNLGFRFMNRQLSLNTAKVFATEGIS